MVKMVELFDRSLKGGIIAFCGRSLRLLNCSTGHSKEGL